MQSFQLGIDGIEIDCVDSVKMLGVTIDHNLKMASHIDTICTKISKLSGLLWRICKSLTLQQYTHRQIVPPTETLWKNHLKQLWLFHIGASGLS